MLDSELWQRISDCHPDLVEADFSFSKRLARDNGWSQAFAKRVILEYQRFAYLSRISSEPVTPSDEVDQAWHLHLTYTKHYWGPFRAALGRPLHHMPTKGGAAQASHFKDLYGKTLDLYRQEFGEPPSDIWPSSAIRFSRSVHFKRVNDRENWVIRKPKWLQKPRNTLGLTRNRPKGLVGLALAAATLLVGSGLAFAHGEAQGDNLFENLQNKVIHWATDHTEMFIFSIICIVIGLIILAKIISKKGDWEIESDCGSDCSSDWDDSGSGEDNSSDSGDSGCSGCGGGSDD